MAKIYEQRGELDKAIMHFANSAERFKALIPYTQRKETELVAKLHGCQEAWEQANGKFVPENKKIALRSYKRFCKATP